MREVGPRAKRSPGSKRASQLERAHDELLRPRAGRSPDSEDALRLERAHAELRPPRAPDEAPAASALRPSNERTPNSGGAVPVIAPAAGAHPASNERTPNSRGPRRTNPSQPARVPPQTSAPSQRLAAPPPRDAAWSPRRRPDERPDERPAEQPAERSDRCHCRGPRPPAARPPSPIATEGVRREVTRQREVARCRGAGVRRPERPGRSGGRPASRLKGACREPPVPPLPPSRPIVLEPIRAPAGSCVRPEGAIAALPARAPGRPPGGVSPQKPPSCSRLGPRNSLTNQVTSR